MGCTKVRHVTIPEPTKNKYDEILPRNGGVFSLPLEASLGLHRNVKAIHGRTDDEIVSLSLTARTPETRKALKTLEAHLKRHSWEKGARVRAEFLPISIKISKHTHILFISLPK